MRNGATLLGTVAWSTPAASSRIPHPFAGCLGYLTNAAFGPDYVLAGSDVAGLWRADNPAERWSMAVSRDNPAGLDYNIARSGCYQTLIAPSDTTRGYAFVRDRLLLSNNKGGNWDIAAGWPAMTFDANAGNARLVPGKADVDPVNKDVVYFVDPTGGLKRTLDAGVSAPQVMASVPVPNTSLGALEQYGLVVIDHTSATVNGRKSRGYCWVAGGGVWMSSDLGAANPTWTQIDAAARALWSMIVDDTGRLIITDFQLTTNNVFIYTVGSGWTNPVIPFRVRQMTQFPGNPAKFIANNDGTFPVVFTNAGLTTYIRWTVFTHEKTKSRKTFIGPNLVRLNKTTSGGKYYFHTDGYVYQMTGLGVIRTLVSAIPASSATQIEWEDVSFGLEALVSHSAYAFPDGSGGTSWFSGNHDKAIIKYEDVRSTRRLPLRSNPEATLTHGAGLDFARDNPLWVVQQSRLTPQLSISTDGGKTYTTPANQPPGFEPGGVAVSNAGNVVNAPQANVNPRFTPDIDTTAFQQCVLREANGTIITPVADGSETGFGFSSYLVWRRSVVADKSVAGRFFLYNYGPTGRSDLEGIYESTDGGANFYKRANGILGLYGGWSAQLVCDDAGSLYVLTGPAGSTATEDPNIRSVRIDTTTWAKTTIMSVNEIVGACVGAPVPGDTNKALWMLGWVSGAYVLALSRDKGASVQTFPLPPSNSMPTCIAASPVEFGHLLSGTISQGVWRGQYLMELS